MQRGVEVADDQRRRIPEAANPGDGRHDERRIVGRRALSLGPAVHLDHAQRPAAPGMRDQVLELGPVLVGQLP
eukprot:7730672-Lingulodinium_polyedra.AAC.1